jgi:hypothetical protein
MANNIGAAMNGGNGKREKGDEFFPTPEGTTRAALFWLIQAGFPKHVWECACGEGHISKVLTAAGYNVFSSNLTDRGYGRIGVNFLSQTKAFAPAVVTNPPFSLSDEFIVHALTVLGIEYLALLLPSGIFHAKDRVKLFRLHTPSLILPLTWRLDVTGQKRPTMNCSWYIWTPDLPPIEGFYPCVSEEKLPGRYDV